jgi:hypothetical protein
MYVISVNHLEHHFRIPHRKVTYTSYIHVKFSCPLCLASNSLTVRCLSKSLIEIDLTAKLRGAVARPLLKQNTHTDTQHVHTFKTHTQTHNTYTHAKHTHRHTTRTHMQNTHTDTQHVHACKTHTQTDTLFEKHSFYKVMIQQQYRKSSLLSRGYVK